MQTTFAGDFLDTLNQIHVQYQGNLLGLTASSSVLLLLLAPTAMKDASSKKKEPHGRID
jgi:hypothetical protein